MTQTVETPARIPQATVRRRSGWPTLALWLLPVAAAALTVGLIWAVQNGQGPLLTLHFQNGHGIKTGDALRYRGLTLGEVETATLGDNADEVIVRVRLAPSAERLAREGSQFWIVRPEVSLSRIRGLETVVGANYIEVAPGPQEAPAKLSFVGLEYPPTTDREPGGLEIEIRFEDAHGLELGSGVRYRGITVGEVTDVSLQRDASGHFVRVQARLSPGHEELAREGSRWWIVRPEVSLTRVRGLETMVGAHYVGVLPGRADAGKQTVFDGLEQAPRLQQEAASEEGDDGVEISIAFAEGHGLAVGDAVKHRGIVVGEVTRVALSDTLEEVLVHARLLPTGAGLARAGSQFWIERPVVSLTEVRGLDTSLQGRYLRVLPGPDDAPPEQHFAGLKEAPVQTTREEGGLDIVLESDIHLGLGEGALVLYRGLPIGHLESVGLASDGARVVAHAYVQPVYRNLVRENSRFWKKKSWKGGLSLGFTGFSLGGDVRMDTLLRGGVEMATPDDPGRTVTTGHRFGLAKEPNEEWMQWQPHIPVGHHQLPDNLLPPQPLLAVQSWRESALLGISSKGRERRGRVLLLSDDSLLGLSSVLTPCDRAIKECTLALDGKEITLERKRLKRFETPHIALYRLQQGLPTASPWPRRRLRHPARPEDCLVIADANREPMALAAARLKVAGDGTWTADTSLPLQEAWHGACVISRQDGTLIGLLSVQEGRAHVLPLPRELEP